MSVKKHIQSFYKSAGENACYAFAVIKAAKKWLESNNREEEADRMTFENSLVAGIEKGWIMFDKSYYASRVNFYMKDPAAFLSYLTGGNWSISFEDRNYKAKAGEVEINFYSVSEKNAQSGIGHFVLAGDTDTLQNSNTVAQGRVYSKRIFRRK